jgi:molybdate transport system permease protein|tara:strand:- start:220 stop:915 length:696 start_codon:yes stop_codon:yes gene_type:complete
MLTPLEWEAIQLSLRVSFWAVLLSLPFGIGIAWLLARYSFPGKSILDALVNAPLVIPPVALGYILLVLFGRTGPVGEILENWFGITLVFTWEGASLASAIVSFPLLVRAIRLSVESLDPGLERAARTLGAGPIWTFITVSLPLIWPGILAGVTLAFARCVGEFGATITFASNIPGETRTLPLALYTLIELPGGEAAALRLMLISIALAIISLFISEFLARRSRRKFGSIKN